MRCFGVFPYACGYIDDIRTAVQIQGMYITQSTNIDDITTVNQLQAMYIAQSTNINIVSLQSAIGVQTHHPYSTIHSVISLFVPRQNPSLRPLKCITPFRRLRD